MLHCWPRIRLNLTLPDLTPQTYLLDCDRVDPVLLASDPTPDQQPGPLMLWHVRRLIEAFYSALDTFPVYLVDLCEGYQGLWATHVLDGPLGHIEPEGVSQHVAVAHLHSLSVQQLLVLSMALKSVDTAFLNAAPSVIAAISAASCSMALRKQWILLSGPDEDLIPLTLALALGLVYFWARPYHALGLLQSIEPAMRHMSARRPDEP